MSQLCSICHKSIPNMINSGAKYIHAQCLQSCIIISESFQIDRPLNECDLPAIKSEDNCEQFHESEINAEYVINNGEITLNRSSTYNRKEISEVWS
jgi:hypothetical protein